MLLNLISVSFSYALYILAAKICLAYAIKELLDFMSLVVCKDRFCEDLLRSL
jgi:hypothetical protein